MHNDSPTLDDRSSLWANDADTRYVNRVKAYRPYGLGPLIRSIQNGEPIIYAMQLKDGMVKVGCTTNLAKRRSQLDGELLGFRFGSMDDETAIHRELTPSRAAKREYYHRSAQVVTFINEMRADLGMDPLTP